MTAIKAGVPRFAEASVEHVRFEQLVLWRGAQEEGCVGSCHWTLHHALGIPGRLESLPSIKEVLAAVALAQLLHTCGLGGCDAALQTLTSFDPLLFHLLLFLSLSRKSLSRVLAAVE